MLLDFERKICVSIGVCNNCGKTAPSSLIDASWGLRVPAGSNAMSFLSGRVPLPFVARCNNVFSA